MSRVETIGDATLYCGDCREIIPTLPRVGAVVTDPPYGIDYRASQPGAIEYGAIVGDHEPFDPTFLLPLAEIVVLWGGNNFSSRLPLGGWIVWDKRCSPAADRMMGSPFELAWVSRSSCFKIIRMQHGGAKNADALNGDVANEARHHPTQKPVRLMEACLGFFDAKSVLDPFMGSGTTGIACVNWGRKFYGIEIDPGHFDTACRRIEQAWKQPRLFEESPPMPTQGALGL